MDKQQMIEAVLEALEGAEQNQIGFTRSDLMQHTGWGAKKAHRVIRQLIDDGQLEYAGDVPFTRVDQVRGWKPAYRFTDDND